jgi:hypothetical protein
MHTQPPTADVDLSAANDAALADLQAELAASAVATPAPVVEKAAAETPAAEAASPHVEVPEPVAQAETPAPAAKVDDPDAIPDDVEELKKGYLRHRDYTKKTMSLAEERKAAQAEAQRAAQIQAQAQQFYQEALQWRELAKDPDALARFADAQRAATNLPAADEPVSYAQLQAIRQRDAQALQAQMAHQFREELIRVETGRQEAQFFTELDAHAAQLLDKHPLLKTQPGITRLIVEDARARGPQNAAEFKRFMAEEAEERHRPLAKMIKDHEQAAIMRHAKAAAPSINPPGGALPAVQSPQKRFKLGSQEFYDSLAQELASSK